MLLRRSAGVKFSRTSGLTCSALAFSRHNMPPCLQTRHIFCADTSRQLTMVVFGWSGRYPAHLTQLLQCQFDLPSIGVLQEKLSINTMCHLRLCSLYARYQSGFGPIPKFLHRRRRRKRGTMLRGGERLRKLPPKSWQSLQLPFQRQLKISHDQGQRVAPTFQLWILRPPNLSKPSERAFKLYQSLHSSAQ
jgi:hypothetical protein